MCRFLIADLLLALANVSFRLPDGESDSPWRFVRFVSVEQMAQVRLRDLHGQRTRRDAVNPREAKKSVTSRTLLEKSWLVCEKGGRLKKLPTPLGVELQVSAFVGIASPMARAGCLRVRGDLYEGAAGPRRRGVILIQSSTTNGPRFSAT